MAKRKAKKIKTGPLTERRQRAVITPLRYDGSRMPTPYISTILPGNDRAIRVRMVAASKAYTVACQVAAAAGVDSPPLSDWKTLEQWSNNEHIKIIQDKGTTVMIERSVVEALGVEWGEQSDYLMHEDIRRYIAATSHQIFELVLEDGRHCHTCRHSHFPNKKRVGLFYGKNYGQSGLSAAIPAGYYPTTVRAKS